MLNRIVDIYLFLPFILSLFLSLELFIRKIGLVDLIVKVYTIFNFVFSFFFLIKGVDCSFRILNFDIISSSFLILSSLVFLFFIFISNLSNLSKLLRNDILKPNRFYYCMFLILMGFVNLFILCDSIFLNLGLVFGILMIFFALANSFLENKEKKKDIKIQLVNDMGFYTIALVLVCVSLIKYFVVNGIMLNFSNIKDYSYIINTKLFFLGFFIIVSRFLNFVFVSYKSIRNLEFINNTIASFINTLSVFLGNVLFLKVVFATLNKFNNPLYSKLVILYLVFNLIYYIILSVKDNNLVCFCARNQTSFSSVGILTLFCLNLGVLESFESYNVNLYLYYFSILILSYILVFFLSIFLQDSTGIKNINDYRRLKKDNRILKVLILFSFLNIACTPLGLFTPLLISLSSIAAINLEICNYLPLVIIFACFLALCNIYNILNKLLITPLKFFDNKIEMSKNWQIIFKILTLVLILSSFLALCY